MRKTATSSSNAVNPGPRLRERRAHDCYEPRRLRTVTHRLLGSQAIEVPRITQPHRAHQPSSVAEFTRWGRGRAQVASPPLSDVFAGRYIAGARSECSLFGGRGRGAPGGPQSADAGQLSAGQGRRGSGLELRSASPTLRTISRSCSPRFRRDVIWLGRGLRCPRRSPRCREVRGGKFRLWCCQVWGFALRATRCL
jgi:hypothetical protein